jgi:hypothetical protein
MSDDYPKEKAERKKNVSFSISPGTLSVWALLQSKGSEDERAGLADVTLMSRRWLTPEPYWSFARERF